MATSKNYRLEGGINRELFRKEFLEKFSKKGNLSSNDNQNAVALLSLIEADPAIKDIRWAAYILATAMWETTSLTSTTAPARNKKGQQLIDKNGKPVVLKQKRWLVTMAPVDEVGKGKGRKYYDPVKIKNLPGNSIQVTEQDGDQFIISSLGKITPITKNASMGSTSEGPRSEIYETDDGAEQTYFGRGYTQLTWWSNYAAAGMNIGVGLKLLIDPEETKNPAIAYALMSFGMVTGKGFSNGHKLSQYLSGSSTNYLAARRMINGQDKAAEIAKIAETFEEIIFASISKK